MINSFEHNLNELLKMKQELIQMKINYSPEIHNYHNINLLEQQSNKLKSAYDEIDVLKQSQYDNTSKFSDLTRELKTYNESLKRENQSLQQEKHLIANQLKNLQEDQQLKGGELHHKLREKDNEINQYKRELENLKLMHSQELYILKKNSNKK